MTDREKTFEFDIPSFGVAVLGAVALLVVLRLVLGGRRDRDPYDRT